MNDIILIALQDEAPSFQPYRNVFFTGVGKINAANICTEIICKYSPNRIFNFGTAGGITVNKGIYHINKFVQRDMLCTSLGFEEGQTPYEIESKIIDLGNGLTCSSGDNFITNNFLSIPADIVDMESYALAKICKKYNIEFKCFKYVTDNGDYNAGNDWKRSVAEGEQSFWKIVKEYKIDIRIQ